MAESSGTVPHKISNITAAFMIGLALLLDGFQFLLTLLVVTAPLSIFIAFLSICIFGVWFALCKVNYFSGKGAGLKSFSVFGSTILELVPFLDGLPGITAGVIGVIVGSRMGETKKKTIPSSTSNRIRFGAQKIPPPTATNDTNSREEFQEAV